MKSKKRLIYPVCFGAVLALFTLFVLLDAFVIPREYASAEKDGDRVARFLASQTERPEEETEHGPETGESHYESETSVPETEPAPEYPVITDDCYKDEYIEIKIETTRFQNANVYIADIKLASPVFLQTAFAKGKFGKNVKAPTSDVAEEVNAILAINGDFYGARDSGFVVRGGTVYRDTPEDADALIISENGDFSFANEKTSNVYDLIENGAYEILSFGPTLVVDGRITASDGKGRSSKDNPRTALGQIDENHYVFVVVDGRTDKSDGLSISELGALMKKIGCKNAYNLDGGGSSTMYFNGRVVNSPTYTGETITERSVSDIVYVGYS